MTECYTKSKGWLRDVLLLSVQMVFYSDLNPNSSPDESPFSGNCVPKILNKS